MPVGLLNFFLLARTQLFFLLASLRLSKELCLFCWPVQKFIYILRPADLHAIVPSLLIYTEYTSYSEFSFSYHAKITFSFRISKIFAEKRILQLYLFVGTVRHYKSHISGIHNYSRVAYFLILDLQ